MLQNQKKANIHNLTALLKVIDLLAASLAQVRYVWPLFPVIGTGRSIYLA